MFLRWFHARWLAISMLAFPVAGAAAELWAHLEPSGDSLEVRGLRAHWDGSRMLLSGGPGSGNYSWVTIPPPDAGWDLGKRVAVSADLTNLGEARVRVMMWLIGDRGWDAVPAEATLAPGETRRFTCQLRETFPDGTPKMDPGLVKGMQIMILGKPARPLHLEVAQVQATGSAPPWQRPGSRLDVPPLEDRPPAPGRRVRFRLPGDEATALYSVLHLPEDWEAGKRYPVIAELPGNIFFVPGCYSTGLPDQCLIGYGVSKGRGAICLGLPFIDRASGQIAEDGWGNPDDTAGYVLRMVEEVCGKFGGDRDNLVLMGFSRGAIACGFIGLRNDPISALWKGFHACQHYDGDGWRGATMEGALERAQRFQGLSVFQTDNAASLCQPVMEAMGTTVTHVRSGLGAHATAMFLDDRPSTEQLRDWFWKLVAVPLN